MAVDLVHIGRAVSGKISGRVVGMRIRLRGCRNKPNGHVFEAIRITIARKRVCACLALSYLAKGLVVPYRETYKVDIDGRVSLG